MPLNPNVEIQGERQCSRLIKHNTRKIMIAESYKVHFVFFKQKDILIDEEISDPWNFAEKLSDSLKLLLTIPMKKRKEKEKVDQGMKKKKNY